MVNWNADLNSLVEETMAFAKSIRVEPNRMPPVNWMYYLGLVRLVAAVPGFGF